MGKCSSKRANMGFRRLAIGDRRLNGHIFALLSLSLLLDGRQKNRPCSCPLLASVSYGKAWCSGFVRPIGPAGVRRSSGRRIGIKGLARRCPSGGPYRCTTSASMSGPTLQTRRAPSVRALAHTSGPACQSRKVPSVPNPKFAHTLRQSRLRTSGS
jgi:hypothetical protein